MSLQKEKLIVMIELLRSEIFRLLLLARYEVPYPTIICKKTTQFTLNIWTNSS